MSLKFYSCLFLIFSSLFLIQRVTTKDTSKDTATIELPTVEPSSTSEPHILIPPIHSIKSPSLYPPIHLNPFLALQHAQNAFISHVIESGMPPQYPFNPFPIYTRLPSQPITSHVFPWGTHPRAHELQSQATEREEKMEESRPSKVLQLQNSTQQALNNTEMGLMNNGTLEQMDNSTNMTKPIDKSPGEGERTPSKPPKRTRIPRIFRNICYREYNCRGQILDLQLGALHCRNRHGLSWKLAPSSPCVNVRGKRKTETQRYSLNDNEDEEDYRDGINDEDDDSYMLRRRPRIYKREERDEY